MEQGKYTWEKSSTCLTTHTATQLYYSVKMYLKIFLSIFSSLYCSPLFTSFHFIFLWRKKMLFRDPWKISSNDFQLVSLRWSYDQVNRMQIWIARRREKSEIYREKGSTHTAIDSWWKNQGKKFSWVKFFFIKLNFLWHTYARARGESEPLVTLWSVKLH